MTHAPPWQRLCDCRCALHYGYRRTIYNNPECGCVITCATQPMTLLAEQWRRALFLDQHGSLRQVPAMANGQWDWANAAPFDITHEDLDTIRFVEQILRLIADLLDQTIN